MSKRMICSTCRRVYKGEASTPERYWEDPSDETCDQCGAVWRMVPSLSTAGGRLPFWYQRRRWFGGRFGPKVWADMSTREAATPGAET